MNVANITPEYMYLINILRGTGDRQEGGVPFGAADVTEHLVIGDHYVQELPHPPLAALPPSSSGRGHLLSTYRWRQEARGS